MLFHPVLKVYQTQHSWIITAHKSLGDLNRQLCMFNQQKTSAHQLLVKLQCQPLASHFVLNILLGEFSNRASTNPTKQPYDQQYDCSKLESELENLSPPENPQSERSLLPFFGRSTNLSIGAKNVYICPGVRSLLHEYL